MAERLGVKMISRVAWRVAVYVQPLIFFRNLVLSSRPAGLPAGTGTDSVANRVNNGFRGRKSVVNWNFIAFAGGTAPASKYLTI
ncbi:hypothetical protein VCV18_012273 [Metarhizium anisopliae]